MASPEIRTRVFPGGVVSFEVIDDDLPEQITLAAADVPQLAQEVRRVLAASGQMKTLREIVESDPTLPPAAVAALGRVLEGPLTGVCQGVPYIIVPGEHAWQVYVQMPSGEWEESPTGVGGTLAPASRAEAQENVVTRLLFLRWTVDVDDVAYVQQAPERLRASLLDEFQYRRNYLAIYRLSQDPEEATWFAQGPLGTDEAWRLRYYRYRWDGLSREAAAREASRS